MRWPSIRSIHAVFILELAGGQVYASPDAGDSWNRNRAGFARGTFSGGSDARMIRVVYIPAHLRTLARVGGEVSVEVVGEPTLLSVLDALEAQYPMLRGTIRDQVTQERRPFVRFFACAEDYSHEPANTRCLPPSSRAKNHF